MCFICLPCLQASDGVRRVSELQKELAHSKQQLHDRKLTAHDAAESMAQLQVCSLHQLLRQHTWFDFPVTCSDAKN